MSGVGYTTVISTGKLKEAKILGLRDLYLAKTCRIKLFPEIDRLLEIDKWSFGPYETD